MTAASLADRYRRALGAAREVAQLDRMLGEIDRELAQARTNASRNRELLAGELAEAARFEHGVWAFLHAIIADRHARVSSAQETAAVLELALHDATAAIEELSHQRDVIAERRDAIAPLANELPGLRAERVAELAGTPSGEEVLVLIERLADLDDELRGIGDAIAAGEAAEDPLIAITTVDAFHTGQGVNRGADVATELTWLQLNLEKHAGRANARLSRFRRALAGIGVQLAAALPSPELGRAFYTSAGARPEYDALWGGVLAVVSEVATRLTELRVRKAQVRASIATLEAERDRLLQPR